MRGGRGGGCYGGVEHENGGGRLRLLTSQQPAAVVREQKWQLLLLGGDGGAVGSGEKRAVGCGCRRVSRLWLLLCTVSVQCVFTGRRERTGRREGRRE